MPRIYQSILYVVVSALFYTIPSVDMAFPCPTYREAPLEAASYWILTESISYFLLDKGSHLWYNVLRLKKPFRRPPTRPDQIKVPSGPIVPQDVYRIFNIGTIVPINVDLRKIVKQGI